MALTSACSVTRVRSLMVVIQGQDLMRLYPGVKLERKPRLLRFVRRPLSNILSSLYSHSVSPSPSWFFSFSPILSLFLMFSPTLFLLPCLSDILSDILSCSHLFSLTPQLLSVLLWPSRNIKSAFMNSAPPLGISTVASLSLHDPTMLLYKYFDCHCAVHVLVTCICHQFWLASCRYI